MSNVDISGRSKIYAQVCGSHQLSLSCFSANLPKLEPLDAHLLLPREGQDLFLWIFFSFGVLGLIHGTQAFSSCSVQSSLVAHGLL